MACAGNANQYQPKYGQADLDQALLEAISFHHFPVGAAKIMIFKMPSLQLARPVCWNASNPWPLVKCPLGRLDGQVSLDATGLHPI